ncbi:MAG: hypothetical protein JNL32_04915 [Candidatus Kapabacteria bacterium]|nr:hypothetical protein [Candidatus Kapabacteria bacterium]
MQINLIGMFFSDEYPLLAVSFAMRNIGASLLKWDNGRKDATPYTYTVGTSIQQPLTDLMSDALLSYDYTSQFGGISKIGFEWKYRKMYALRAGVNGRSGTLGGGLDFGFLIADYGYIFPSSQLIGDIHSLTVSFRLERVLQ